MRTNWSKAVRRGLIIEVLERGRIETTLTKAKSVQGEIDRVVNLLKEKSVNSRRQLVKMLGQEIKIDKDFSSRNSGYSRIIRLGQRFSDAAEKVVLELIFETPKAPEEPKAPKKPKKLKKTEKS